MQTTQNRTALQAHQATPYMEYLNIPCGYLMIGTELIAGDV
ncbi:hypothetical protein MnTg02_02304 [bacterium MnTg02]|nr:hypothetical protein MnTg02_02304 [bacterium MnTg02]